jgi:hypothetical protein
MLGLCLASADTTKEANDAEGVSRTDPGLVTVGLVAAPAVDASTTTVAAEPYQVASCLVGDVRGETGATVTVPVPKTKRFVVTDVEGMVDNIGTCTMSGTVDGQSAVHEFFFTEQTGTYLYGGLNDDFDGSSTVQISYSNGDTTWATFSGYLVPLSMITAPTWPRVSVTLPNFGPVDWLPQLLAEVATGDPAEESALPPLPKIDQMRAELESAAVELVELGYATPRFTEPDC